MTHLPIALAAAVAAGAAAGIEWPSLEWLGAGVGLAGWALAVAAFLRRWPSRVVLMAGLCGLSGMGVMRGAEAFLKATRPSLVAALEQARLLDGDAGTTPVPVRFEGHLTADATEAERSVLLRVAVTRVWLGLCSCPVPVDGQVMVAVGGYLSGQAQRGWRSGRRLSMTGVFRRVHAFQNMGASDAAHDALRRHVALMASVKSSLLVEVQSPGSWGDEVAAALRAHARRAIAAAADRDVVAAAVGTAVVIGDRAGLEPDLVSRLQQAGTFHVIAISGGNIALIVVVVMAVIRRLTTRRATGALCAAAVLVGYAILVGGGASVVRATGMALIGIAALAADLRGAALNVLALTAVILVVADPLLTVDTAFWLTCMATGAMVIGLPPSMARSRSWRERLRIALLSSVWAEAALLPIVATVFQQVTLAGLVLNIVAIPGMALVQASAMAAVGAEPLSDWLVAASGVGLRLGAWLVVAPARLVEWCPWLVWRVSPPGAVAVVGYYMSAGAWIWSHRAASSRAARLRIPSTVLGLSMTVWVAVAPFDFVRRAPRDLRLTTLDVGQGDSLLLQFPNGTRMLLDGGASSPGGFDVGARVVGPALRARGIRTLDYVVVTHADADHIGGVAALVREFQPREVWTGVPVDGDEATARVRVAADRVGAVWRPLQRGERVNVGPVDVAVLHPPPPEWDRQRVRNDDSVVLGVTWGDVRFLLTGDIGEAVERDLLSAFPDLAKPMTVLKVAHHGSGGSSSAPFLEHLHPSVALISAGADNPFGHPTRLTLDRLGAVAADVWRTDRDGEITVRTDGRTLEVVARSGRQRWFVPQGQ